MNLLPIHHSGEGILREAEIVDGRNVRESYMVVPLSNVKRLLFEVEI